MTLLAIPAIGNFRIALRDGRNQPVFADGRPIRRLYKIDAADAHGRSLAAQIVERNPGIAPPCQRLLQPPAEAGAARPAWAAARPAGSFVTRIVWSYLYFIRSLHLAAWMTSVPRGCWGGARRCSPALRSERRSCGFPGALSESPNCPCVGGCRPRQPRVTVAIGTRRVAPRCQRTQGGPVLCRKTASPDGISFTEPSLRARSRQRLRKRALTSSVGTQTLQ